MPSLLIAGASGLVGNATLERALSRNGWTDVVGLSRRRPEVDTIRPYRHLSIDLRDADSAKAGLSDVGDITLYEKPG
jgi:nucleoside-diphosphate-sugar epimerase